MLNIFLPYDLAVPLLGMYSREIKTCPYKNLYVSVHNNIIQNSQKVETTQCPWMDDWTNVVYPYYRIIFCLKKEGYSDTCYNMDEV